MSIGIAIAFGDVVVMVADGRRSDAFKVHTDEAEKIVDFSDSLAVIEFGAIIASTTVVEELRAVSQVPMAGAVLVDFLTKGVRYAGVHLLAAVIPGSTDMSRVKVGLLAGGIDAEGAYIGGALFGHGMTAPSAFHVRPDPTPQFIVLGGENGDAQAYFKKELVRAYHASGSDQATFIVMAKRAAKRTVRYAASHDHTIGGRVQCYVLQRAKPIERGFL